ncbi:regulatory protein RecX [uncultured Agrococcus sp.]|uniref:regulatory protein RecX n=1 Tax=uncultured Agrococcus sp. TaxID=382258 RepID=UPI0025E9FE24|nr:regulatory protein RecX [uncultured Agrococcus sp.]
MNFEVTPMFSAPPSSDGESESEEATEAYEIALRVLASRAMSSGKLRERLMQRDVERSVADAVVQRVIDAGYLNDQDFAASAIERLRTRKKLGDGALRQELVKLGVRSADAEEALREHAADDETDLALAAARERAPRLRSLDRQTAERRLLGFLQRRGHGGSTASRAVKTALDEVSGPRHRVSFE